MKNVLINEWNKPRVPYPANLCLHTLFEAEVAKVPELPAFIDDDITYTYKELNARTNQLAFSLRERGIKEGTTVACHFKRSSSVVLCILAILKAGGLYLLLDPNIPTLRIQYFIRNAEPILIITDTKLSIGDEFEKIPIIDIEDLMRASYSQRTENPLFIINNENPAYMAYTSGTTGNPKAVLISHRSCVNHVYAFSKMFELNPKDRIPLIASITFDVAIEEMLPPLLSGCVIIASNPSYNLIKDFNDEIQKNKYSVLNLPVPLWHSWSEYLFRDHLPVPESLRLVIVGSDRIYTKHYAEWREIQGADRIQWVTAYGTTETSVTSAFYTTANLDDLTDEVIVPIGKPIANTYLYILDDNQQPVEIGGIGEICIGGDGVGLGYYKLPEITMEKFLPDPFCSEPNGRLYRTGDMGRCRPDGNIICLGRQDLQIKINGLRFELGEIEAALNANQEVKHSYVILHQHDEHERSKRLTAFITLKENSAVTHEAIKLLLHDWSKERLHHYVQPHDFVILQELPLTNSGKVDRAYLKKIAIEYKEL